MGDWRDSADHTEGSVLDDGQSVVSAKDFAGQKLYARGSLAQHLKLFNLVLQPTDFRFGKFHTTEFFGVVDGDAANVRDRLASAF